MSETSTPKALLIVALQDLLEGERAWLTRLPELRPRTPSALQETLAGEMARSQTQADRLEALLSVMPPDAPAAPNLWLNAVIDDATRDSETIAAGTLRAIAMVGAFRKGKQSERVSYETAIGLAEALGLTDAARDLAQSREEEVAADAELAELLRMLLAQIG